MYYNLSNGNRLYRVTDTGSNWPTPLLGTGAYFTKGGRYNFSTQATVYCAEDPLAVIAEAAFYEAIQWQSKISYHRFNPVSYPLVSYLKLWCFSITPPPTIVDLEHPQSLNLFQHSSQMLFNLSYNPSRDANIQGQSASRDYFGTQHLANEIRGTIPPSGSTSPRPEGIRAPAIRVKRIKNYQAQQLALFVFTQEVHQPYKDRSTLILEFDLEIEFLQRSPRVPVTKTTIDIDWSKPKFRLSNPGGTVLPSYTIRPGSRSYSPNRWYNIEIQFD